MFDPEKLKKIQEYAVNHLEADASMSPEPIEPEVNGKWRRLTDRKWEFRYHNIVLATIFHKPNNKFSLFCKTPDMYDKVHRVAADTFLFNSFEEASQQFLVLLKDRSLQWCYAVIDLLEK